MRLDDITIHIRPRSPWEAMDLGLRLVQVYWRPLYRSWLVVVLPLFLLFNLLLPDAMWLAGLLMWWLKPFYDRVVLHVLSRELFGERVSVIDTLRSLPRLLKTGLLLNLTLLRLAPGRSFTLPVWQLEGLRGKARRERLRVLMARTAGRAYWLFFVCIHAEFILLLGLYGLIYMLLPQDSGFEAMSPFLADDPPYWAELVDNALYLLAISLVEPFYVAAGFMLYVNRRTELEAWDIELVFRRLAQRLQGLATAALIVLVIGLGLGHAPSLQAAETASPPLPVTESERVIAEILAHEDFAINRSITIWLPRDLELDLDPDELEDEDLFPWLPVLLADGLKLLLVLLVIGLGIYLYRNRQAWLDTFARGDSGPAPPPASLFGLDLQPESLPDDIAAEARRLWQAGQVRAALGLLYRGSLSQLVNERQLALHNSMTEGDVLEAARTGRLPGELIEYLARLTRAWQSVAYAHRPPPGPEAEGLFADWPARFDAPVQAGDNP